jgi:hypothetical protein
MYIWDPVTSQFITEHEMGTNLSTRAKTLNVQMSSTFEFNDETSGFNATITDYDFYNVLADYFVDHTIMFKTVAYIAGSDSDGLTD